MHIIGNFAEKVKSLKGVYLPISRLMDSKHAKVSKFGISSDFGDFMDIAKKYGIHRNPIMANAADYVNWIFYDTLTVAAAGAIGASFNFFTTPISATKTKMQTNLEQVQQLPNPQWFNCIGIGFEFGSEVTLADVQTVINNYLFEFWVGSKTYAEGIYTKYPSGGGVTGAISTGTGDAATASVLTNGVPQLSNMFDLRLPQGLKLGMDNSGAAVYSDGLTGVTILQGQQFKIVNTAPGGSQSASADGNGIRFRCDLLGVLNRGVQ